MTVFFTDRGIEELDERRGGDQMTLGWLATRLRAFADLHPDFDVPAGRLATRLARPTLARPSQGGTTSSMSPGPQGFRNASGIKFPVGTGQV